MSAPTVVTPDEVLDPQIVEVSDDIYAYLQLYGQWGLNNAGFVVGPDHCVVIDTCFTVDRATAFRQQLEVTTPKRPRTLLSTHHHGDHTYGNFLFRDATIIGHERCREEMIDTGLETTKLFQEGVNWGDIEISASGATTRRDIRRAANSAVASAISSAVPKVGRVTCCRRSASATAS